MSEINKELLAKVRDHILEEPRRYNQGTFGKKSEIAPCGTEACLAGWTVFLVDGVDITQAGASPRTQLYVQQRAADLLGLTTAERFFKGGQS